MKYAPRPLDLYIYVLPLLLLGAYFIPTSLQTFGWAVFSLGGGCGFWIVVSGIYQSMKSAWEAVPEIVIRKMEQEEQLRLKELSRPPVVRIVEHTKSGFNVQGFIPPIHPDKFRKISIGYIKFNKPLSESEWTPKATLLSSGEWRDLASYMMHKDRQLWRWNNEGNHLLGISPTHRGSQVHEQWAQETLNTTPNLRDPKTPPLLESRT